MTSSTIAHDLSNAEAGVIRARLREGRAAINFAPPVLERLNETYNRPRKTYYAFDHKEINDEPCITCGALDLGTLFSHGTGFDFREGIRVRKGIPMGWSDEIYERKACPLCRLLVDVGDTRMSDDRREVEFWYIITVTGHDVIYSTSELSCKEENTPDVSGDHLVPEAFYLALVRTVKPPPGYGFEYRTLLKDLTYIGLSDADSLIPSGSFSLRDFVNAKDTVKIIRNWLARCNKDHRCWTAKADASSFPNKFRLFDIRSLHIVESEGQESYIALSYPWTQIENLKAIKQDTGRTLDACPQILQDIINIIQDIDLGISHIWIDQLCIDQEDCNQKQENIDAMGTIYSAAFATFILAVPPEDTPQKGLAGFSIERKPYQRTETIGKTKLATTLPSLEMAILTSQWNTRGWTFQEGLLSSRCIIFGAEQIYFECQEMACCESIHDRDSRRTEQSKKFPHKSRLRNPLLYPYDFKETYWRLVRDYTGRDLTLPSDALNAFAALANVLEQDGHKLFQGMPISETIDYLLWEHEPWDFRDIHRRRDFPSWSWAGWCGTAAMNIPFDAISEADSVCEVIGKPSHGHCLRINARTAHVSVTCHGPIGSIIEASKSSVIMARGMLDEPISGPQIYILMEVFRTKHITQGLLLERKGEVYERVGSGHAKFINLENIRFQWQELWLA
ncbi:uncharacterized protein KY384_001151 [Bacidia gigantensis]|uniref:uncharacterized protein n=1 Tax=Bacidia gigantensis TaxID=2732470 RepID=UPI001D04B481|nr:uncharacterized protein KY384_001151 [Bacidia gigantensis]KAG8534307.1 hypothetical protein KY384_001151 [Bacidia gigantensis]